MPAPTLLNPSGFRILTQTDAFNTNQPADENANGLDEPWDHLGAALVTGDFNRDGYADLAAGATGEAAAGAPHTGAVYLWQGSGGGLTLGRYLVLLPPDAESAQDGSHFGAALAAGDVNGDKYVDLVVGAPGQDVQGLAGAGAAWLYEGSSWRPQKSHPLAPTRAAMAGEAFGSSAVVADIQGDRHADVIIGAPGRTSGGAAGAGGITLLPGSKDWLGGELPFDQASFGGANEPGDAFGAALAAGDFNGDSYADLAVAAPGKANGAGAVYVVDGSRKGLAQGQLYTAAEAKGALLPGADFGASLTAGDFNGDGLSDLVIAAPGEPTGQGLTPGAIYLLYGAKGGGLQAAGRWTASQAGTATPSGGRFGQALAVGDLNHDGKSDLVVGAPIRAETIAPASAAAASQGGAVYLFAGAGQGLLPGPVLKAADWGETPVPGDGFGASVALGNILGTGASDLVVGAPDATASGQLQSGALYFVGGLPSHSLITHGAVLGAVTDHSIKIWARADRSAAYQLKFKRTGTANWTATPALALTADEDFSGVITLNDLQPDTQYEYVVVLDGVEQPDRGGEFTTLKPQGQPLAYRFALGADMYYPNQPFTIFNAAAAKEPSFMLLIGDQIYADGPDLVADTKAGYERKYKENWADPAFAAFARRRPTFMIWDDHEIMNDWDFGKSGRYQSAKLAYDEYQNRQNPEPLAPGENYYTFSVGDTDFFVLDARSFRSEKGMPAGPTKTMLGAQQKQALEDWLLNSKAAFKFIVSSIPFNKYANTGSVEEGQDNWNNYQHERAEIFNLIRDHCIGGVVLLTGDQHWTGMFKLPYAEPVQLYEFMPNPLAVPLRPMTDSTDPAILYKDNTKLIYGLFDVDTTVQPPRIHHEMLDRDNNVVYQLDVTTDDILPPGACTPK